MGYDTTFSVNEIDFDGKISVETKLATPDDAEIGYIEVIDLISPDETKEKKYISLFSEYKIVDISLPTDYMENDTPRDHETVKIFDQTDKKILSLSI